MNAMTQTALEQMLGRKVSEMILIIAKSAVVGMDAEAIGGILGATKAEVEEIQNTQDYRDVRLLVGAEYARARVETDFSWDGIESTALEGLSKRVGLERDTETLLRIAAVANKAQRRNSAKQDNVLDPAGAAMRVPLTLTRRFTEKLNSDNQVVERIETQQISVVNGTAKNPTFAAIDEIFKVKRTPPEHIVTNESDELEKFLSSIPNEEE